MASYASGLDCSTALADDTGTICGLNAFQWMTCLYWPPIFNLERYLGITKSSKPFGSKYC